MRKLCQVVGLVIIRHVISTRSPPVAGSCEQLIGGVHSQFVVLSSSQREVLCCISMSSKTLTVTVFVYTAAQSWVSLFTGGKNVRIQAQVCACVFSGGVAECKYAYLVHDQTYAIICWLAVIVVTSDKAD